MIRFFIPLLCFGILLYLFKKKYISRTILLLCLAGTAASGVLIFAEIREGENRKVTTVSDKDFADGENLQLNAVTEEGDEYRIDIPVKEKSLSDAETEKILSEKAAQLDELILGKNTSADRIEWNMNLITLFDDTETTCEWMTSSPEVLAWDGVIGTDVNPSGESVTLNAELTLNGENREFTKTVKVYPSKEPETVEQELREEFSSMNEGKNGEDDAYVLPDTVNGHNVSWYEKNEKSGAAVCILILLTALMSVFAEKKKKEGDEEKRKEQLIKAYPDIVSRLQLLTTAGLSLRRSMKKLAEDYGEVRRCWYEMENGVTEQDAYRRFGERCGTAEYKRLALLLAQSQKKGGQQFSMLLEQETQEAYELRKRNARAESERAAVKMVLPMGMMLVVVLVIIMVPAMMSF